MLYKDNKKKPKQAVKVLKKPQKEMRYFFAEACISLV